MKQRLNTWIFSAVVLPILAYGILATWRLDWPGLYYDEMLFVNAALGGADDTFVTARWHGMPILLMPYIGALKAWIYAPIFRVFDVSVWSVRLPAVVLGAVSIALSYAYVRRLFSPEAGRLAAWMMAVEPGFVFHTRWDWGPTAVMMACKAAFLLGVIDWWRTRRRRSYWLATAAAVLGTFDKFNFLWVVVAATAAIVVIAPRTIGRFFVRHPLTALGPAIVAVASVAALWAMSRTGFAIQGELGVSDWGARLATVGRMLRQTIGGVGPYEFIIGESGSIASYHLLISAVAGAVALAAFLIAAERSNAIRPMMFVLATAVVLLVVIAVTRRATGPHHTVMLFPLWLVLLAGMAATPLCDQAGPLDGGHELESPGQVRRQRAARVLSRTAAVMVLASSLVVNCAYLRRIDGPVANVNWDPGSYALARHAQANPNLRYVSLDWGIHTVLQGLTQGCVRCLDRWALFMKPMNAAEAEYMERTLLTPDTVFVARAAGAENFPQTRDNFFALREQRDWTFEPAAAFQRSDGRPLLELYRVRYDRTDKPADVSSRTPTAGPLTIRRVHPQTIRAGERFNVQPDGQSALAVECANATQDTSVMFDGMPLSTTFGGPKLVTAILPPNLYARPGRHTVSLKRGPETSDPVDFNVNR